MMTAIRLQAASDFASIRCPLVVLLVCCIAVNYGWGSLMEMCLYVCMFITNNIFSFRLGSFFNVSDLPQIHWINTLPG